MQGGKRDKKDELIQERTFVLKRTVFEARASKKLPTQQKIIT